MINEADILLFLMVLFRMTAFFSIAKVFFPAGTPKLTKLLFSLICTFVLFPVIGKENALVINNMFSMTFAIASEVLTGILMGYVTNLCFNFIKMAGQFLDIHVGFSMSTLIDPMESESVTLIENFLYMTAIVIFLIIDGHHILIKAFIGSFRAVPIGNGIIIGESFSMILKAFIYFFTMGVRISLPVTLVLLLVNFVMGIASRTVPQLNIMILGLPIKIVIGLAVLILSLPLIMKLYRVAFEQIPKHIINVLTAMGPVMFVFADNGDKTEDATPKKKSDARKKGQVARSKELSMTATLIAITFVMMSLGEFCFNNMTKDFYGFFYNYLNVGIDKRTLNKILFNSAWSIIKVTLPVALSIMVVGIVSNIAQTGFLYTTEPLKPNLSKLNPLKGFKNFFSVRAMADLVKNIAVISLLIYVSYRYCIKNFSQILNISHLRLGEVMKEFNRIIVQLLFQVSMIMTIISVADYFFQRFQHKKDLKMSKQEIKEEFKQMEGDPQIKGKIRQKQREMATQRMMQSVPDATVVITNPTHFAVAIKYNDEDNRAPVVVAKGADYVAFKIKDIASKNNVPVYENKPLARTIYDTVEIDSEIPEELYQAVAEILAFIYSESGRKPVKN
ncbi:flagellar biosynthetic protein FliR/FlhB [Hathewaya proteolytica DSM 3090]|uniref:Flagellar biosynthetic protein FliR n=1 Tax=Hathewaya proteolytica DSM 3090 TaxID=1121331 RepID=A0A1M6L9E2_9CLOT|nr:fused FliR family export protein/FlhB family type III secretion system protein [Hathewaya proteolytica]SHJ67821.1 flagellar biosynthetic protein FliR/FlhB [Hathewaya proteolytica DSM 3090]